jgi:hypothetical protein
MGRWPTGAQALLEKLDHHPRSRAELSVLSRISDRDWLNAIRFLVSEGLARQTGSKRGTRYQRSRTIAVDSGTTLLRSADGHVDSVVRVSYHDELIAALDVLERPAAELTCTNSSDHEELDE